MNRARFQRKGPLALDASAWGQEYELIKPAPLAADGGIAVVMIMGPLTHHGDWWGGDTYDAIEARVQAALDTSAAAVVMKIASPGGEVDGMIECSRTLRRMAEAKGKRLVAYVDEVAASAAYALACAAKEIYLPASGQVGSIGVIDVVCDATAADHQDGLNMTVITSGARKADGNPHVQLTDETKSVLQANVNGLAGLFFGLVGEARGVDPFVVQAMQAAMYRGQDAVTAKLANGVKRWDELLAMLASGESDTAGEPTAAGHSEASMPNYAKALEAIKAALAEDAPAAPPPEKKEGEAPAMDAAGFKSALKALLAEEPAPHKEPDGDEGAAPAKPADGDGDEAAKAAARAAAAKPAATAPVAAPQASSPATDPAMQMAAELQSIKAELAADKEAKERAELLAQRPDFSSKVLAMLAGKPIDYLRFAVENFPKSTIPSPAAAAQVQPLIGAGQGSVQASLPVSDAQRLNAAMGLTIADESIRWDRHDRVFPAAMSPKAALELLKTNEAAVKAANERTGGAK